ncbi:MAG: hypothetical protein KDB00_29255, partial [Planctomycetales bacterium]|nr:hypothetical protein [Planctomycetales bacterium]
MQCPQCDAPLRLVVDTTADVRQAESTAKYGFRIVDLLAVTALVALHLAAFPILASPSGTDWPMLLYFSPTAITCLLHLRLRLGTSAAMGVHYAATLVWMFLYSLGQNAAINAYNTANPSPGRNYQLALYSNAWNEMVGMAVFGLAWAAAYGLICYTALNFT